MLEVRALKSGYDTSEVLHGVSLKAEQGKITLIIGPNGAGKTTLLKTIIKILPSQEGQIFFEDKDVTVVSTSSMIQLGIGYVPQATGAFPNLSVRDNIRLGAYVMPDKKTIGKKSEEVFQLFPILKERAQQMAGTLSGGERQMLLIARALMANPKLLMLDEPSTGLDAGKQNAVFEKLKKLNATGLTILIVEQNVKAAIGLADYVYVIDSGKVTNEGDAQSILAQETLLSRFIRSASLDRT
ncbi:MAG: ABC transporter ATP-binding protein [Nitrososphaerota archaeon]|nr:ABC transporter ATP-binding protein [Nitrososphaerota archaeon]